MPETEAFVMRFVERATSAETIEGKRCFACGGPPSTGHGEHVVPLWLQHRFGLLDKRLTLLNGTKLPYRHLTVPCCKDCNNGFLRNLEDSVLEIVDSSRQMADGDRLIMAQWLCKIFIGILVKESSLAADRRHPSRGNIVPASLLAEFSHAQLILQSARKKTAFRCLHGQFPCTIYAYKILSGTGFGEFDLSTNIDGQSIAIRFGSLGFVFVNDGGLQLVAGAKGPYGLDLDQLHPLQFSEISARVHYKATLRDATHHYLDLENPELLSIEQLSVIPFTNIRLEGGDMQIFRPWDDLECAELIARYRGVPLADVYEEVTGSFWTTLVNSDGKLLGPDYFIVPVANG